MDLVGSRGGSPVRRMGSEICWERNSSLVFTRREPRSNAEWHLVLQMKSRDEKWDPRDHLSQLLVEESGGGADPIVRGTRIRRPDRDIADSYHRLLLLSDSFSSVPRETRDGDTPPALFFMTIATVGPEDETEGCPRSERWYQQNQAKISETSENQLNLHWQRCSLRNR